MYNKNKIKIIANNNSNNKKVVNKNNLNTMYIIETGIAILSIGYIININYTNIYTYFINSTKVSVRDIHTRDINCNNKIFNIEELNINKKKKDKYYYNMINIAKNIRNTFGIDRGLWYTKPTAVLTLCKEIETIANNYQHGDIALSQCYSQILRKICRVEYIHNTGNSQLNHIVRLQFINNGENICDTIIDIMDIKLNDTTQDILDKIKEITILKSKDKQQYINLYTTLSRIIMIDYINNNFNIDEELQKIYNNILKQYKK